MARQLKMVWPGGEHPPEVHLPDGYAIRTFCEGDAEQFVGLLNNKDLGDWTLQRLQSVLSNPLSPDGVFFATWKDDLVATACALDRSSAGRGIGEVGWVAADPAHSGKNLGMAVSAVALEYLLDRGYDDIYLLTDPWRYPALKIYLKLGFEPRRDGPDDRYLWAKIGEQFQWQIPQPKQAPYLKHPTGEEIAWRTLNKENVGEPCIITGWCMKRAFFQALTHRQNIYTQDAPQIVVEAFIRAGANLCPQFIMPSPDANMEHRACNPFHIVRDLKKPGTGSSSLNVGLQADAKQPDSPEGVCEIIDAMPHPDTLERGFNFEAEAETYANYILGLRDMARGEMLFVSGFGQVDFMGVCTLPLRPGALPRIPGSLLCLQRRKRKAQEHRHRIRHPEIWPGVFCLRRAGHLLQQRAYMLRRTTG